MSPSVSRLRVLRDSHGLLGAPDFSRSEFKKLPTKVRMTLCVDRRVSKSTVSDANRRSRLCVVSVAAKVSSGAAAFQIRSFWGREVADRSTRITPIPCGLTPSKAPREPAPLAYVTSGD